MKTLLTLALLASSCFASRITDTLQDSSLVNFTGNITVRWPAYKDINGVDQPQGKQTVYVVNGALDITLPATTDFRYEVFGRNYTGTLYSTNWIVPNTASTLTLIQVAPVIATTGTTSIYPTIGQSFDQTLASTNTPLSLSTRFYSANPTATLADAQAAAQLLADRTSYWLIQLNPIAANSTRFVIPQGSVNYAHSTLNVAIQTSTSAIRAWATSLSTAPYYATANTCWGVVTALSQGCWGGVNGQLAPDHTYGITMTANPVLLVNNPVMVDRLARAMAQNYLDTEFAGLYAQFTSNAPSGTPGSALTDATLGVAVNTIQVISTVTKGQPVFIVLSEESLLQAYFQASYTAGSSFSYPFTLPNLISYLKRGLPMILGQTTLGGQATDPWELLISNQINVTGTSPKVRHSIAFSSTAMGMYSMQPNANEDINNVANSGAIAAGFGIMGASTAACTANNFCSAIKYSTSATSGQNFSFTVAPAWGVGILENAHGVRIEH